MTSLDQFSARLLYCLQLAWEAPNSLIFKEFHLEFSSKKAAFEMGKELLG